MKDTQLNHFSLLSMNFIHSIIETNLAFTSDGRSRQNDVTPVADFDELRIQTSDSDSGKK